MQTSRRLTPVQNVFDMAKARTNSVRQDRHTVFGYSGVDAKYQDLGGTDQGQTWGQPPIRRPGQVGEKWRQCKSTESLAHQPSYTLIVRTGGLGDGTTATSPRSAQRGPIVRVLRVWHHEPTKAPAPDGEARPKEVPYVLEPPGALSTRLSAQSCGHLYAQATAALQGDAACTNSARG